MKAAFNVFNFPISVSSNRNHFLSQIMNNVEKQCSRYDCSCIPEKGDAKWSKGTAFDALY